MSGAQFLADLAARGRYHFTADEAAVALGSSRVADPRVPTGELDDVDVTGILISGSFRSLASRRAQR